MGGPFEGHAYVSVTQGTNLKVNPWYHVSLRELNARFLSIPNSRFAWGGWGWSQGGGKEGGGGGGVGGPVQGKT